MNYGNNNSHFEELSVKLNNYKFKTRTANNDLWFNNNPLIKNIYVSLEKFLKEIERIPSIQEKNERIETVYKWYHKSMKTNKKKVMDNFSINFYIPFVPKKNDNQTKLTKGSSLADLCKTTKKVFNEGNKGLNGLMSVNEYVSENVRRKNNFIPPMPMKRSFFINKDKIVKAVSLSKSRNESTQRMIPTVENNKTVIQSKEIRKNDNKVRMIFRQKKKKQERNSFSQTALRKKNISNENSTKNIMPLPQSLSSQREKENIKLPDMKEFGELNTQLERYRCLKQIYKEKKSTLDFRKTVSNFKYMELSSLKDLLERKKRKFNLKCLHDAFINPIGASQPTFYLPKGGCGLLSKPEYLD